MTTVSNRPGRIFYGWWILAAAFAGEMFAIGSTTYAFGLFVKPLSAEFGTDRATINYGLMLFIVGMGLSAPLVGRLLDRQPARLVLAGGALLMGAGLIGVALAPSLALMALCIVLPVAVGATAIGPLAANTLASRWFERRRGVALGIVAVGTSVGGTLLVPLMAFTVMQYGWRAALMIQGVLIAVTIGAVALFVLRDRPADIGLSVDGDAAPAAKPQPAVAADAGSAWRRRDFWCIALAVALLFGITQATLISLVPYATDRNFTLAQAQWLVSCLAACSIVGKLALGAAGDRFDKRWLLLIVAAAVAVEQLMLMAAPGYTTLLIVCGLAGFASGGTLPLWAAITAERFGSASLGSVLGLMNPVNMIISLIAIRFIGRTYDVTGNYVFAFQVFLAVTLAAAILVLAIPARDPKISAAQAARA